MNRPLPDSVPNLENPKVLLILDAAREAFSERGFHATSMREIATRAGVSKALIHYHFDSKERLFLELLNHIHRTIAATIETSALENLQPGIAAAERAYDLLVVAMIQLAPLTAIFAEVGVVGLQQPKLRNRIQELLEETRSLFEYGIRLLLGDDLVARLPMTPRAAAELLYSSLLGVSLSGLYDEDSLSSQFEAFKTLIFLPIRNVDGGTP